MSRNTPIGKGQWVRPVPSDCSPVRELEGLSDGRKSRFDGYKSSTGGCSGNFPAAIDREHGPPDCMDYHGLIFDLPVSRA